MHPTLVFFLLMLVGGVMGVHALVAKDDVDKDMGSILLCVFRIKGQVIFEEGPKNLNLGLMKIVF